VNLSGRAVAYWLQKENIELSNLLVLVDDLALPFGTIRVRAKGSAGGHNGLENINQVLGRNEYARLRFGIGDNFHKGFQVDYVLGEWDREEAKELPAKIDTCIEIINSFGTIGTERTMNFYNKK
jgi:PTH1 family peptidyl-tRNA hydrolase